MEPETPPFPLDQRPRRKQRTWLAFVIACTAIALWAYRGTSMLGAVDPVVGVFVVAVESLVVWGALYAFSLRRNGSIKINLLYLAGIVLCGAVAHWAGGV